MEARRSARRARRVACSRSVPFVAGFTGVFVALGALVGALGLVDQRVVRGDRRLRARRLRSRVRAPPADAASVSSRRACSSARATAARTCCSAAPSPSARRRASARSSSSALVLAGSSSTVAQGALLLFAYSLGLAVPFVLPGSCSRPRWVVPLAARSLPLLRDRRRAHPRRARPAVVLRPDVVAAVGLRPLSSRDAAARARAIPRRRSPARARPARARAATSTPRCAGANGASRRAAFSSCRSHPTRLPRPAWYQRDGDVHEPLEEVASVGSALRATPARAPRAPRRSSARGSARDRARSAPPCRHAARH